MPFEVFEKPLPPSRQPNPRNRTYSCTRFTLSKQNSVLKQYILFQFSLTQYKLKRLPQTYSYIFQIWQINRVTATFQPPCISRCCKCFSCDFLTRPYNVLIRHKSSVNTVCASLNLEPMSQTNVHKMSSLLCYKTCHFMSRRPKVLNLANSKFTTINNMSRAISGTKTKTVLQS